ncbi:MAG TPA: peptidoglycan-binding domain-containing protein [Acidimicrobiales bacterium]|nr:peptidoglycan-binding domain-containing protein [Acidimicrobiales bacterium]
MTTPLAPLFTRRRAADRLASRLVVVARRAAACTRVAAADVSAATLGLAAVAVEPGGVPVGPLAVAVGRTAPPPSSLAVVAGEAVGRRTRRLLDDVAERFADVGSWSDPDHARFAAGLFVGSLALSLAGLVGAISVAAPEPSYHLQRLATIVNLADAAPATAGPLPAPTTTAAPPADPEVVAPAAPVAVPPGDASAELAAPAPVLDHAAETPIGARPPTARGGLPVGKGMWIWLEDRAEGGDVDAIVARAKATGLTHLYVRTGTLKGGFVGGPFLDRLLPTAHRNGIRVYGWDFPYLDHPGDDVNRALAAIRHTTPDGHRIDGFSSDIESTFEGVNNDVEHVTAYSTWLRANVGPNYPLIATVPNPTVNRLRNGFPYGAIIPSFDAVAPMVYWMNRDPGADVVNAVAFFAQWGKPVFPVGQAYDGGPEGGPPGVPGREAIIRFLQHAEGSGATGASFWSWQHATPEVWDAVRDAAEFRLDVGGPAGEGLTPGMVRAYQTVLVGFGFGGPIDGAWGPTTVGAVRAYQAAARLPVTGRIDENTRAFLLAPVAAPIVPEGH